MVSSHFHESWVPCGCFIMTKNIMADILVFESSILVKMSISYGVLCETNLQNGDRRGRSFSFSDIVAFWQRIDKDLDNNIVREN